MHQNEYKTMLTNNREKNKDGTMTGLKDRVPDMEICQRRPGGLFLFSEFP